MIAESPESIRGFVHGMTVATITRPSRRDQQTAPGPSDLANKCDLCVARRIALHLGVPWERRTKDFSLKAWNGTAVHSKLEKDQVYPHAELEVRVHIGDIPGIGPVSGSADVFLPWKRTVVDFKTSDLEKIAKYKKAAGATDYTRGLTVSEREEVAKLTALDRAGMLGDEGIRRLMDLEGVHETLGHGIPPEYVGQAMLYLYGLRRMGKQAEHACLVFIPRDSNSVKDIWTTYCAYREEVAVGTINRAAHIAEMVRNGTAVNLKPDPECFPCVIGPRIWRRKVIG